MTIKTGNYFGQAPLLQYDYLSKEHRGMKNEQIGLIEVPCDISIMPPTEGHFLISELNPRSEIH